MIHTDEDDEFERIERENNLKGQPYHFDELFVSVSQRNQVIEECAKVADGWSGHYQAIEIAKEIRSLKK
jgi:hypothetical protein